MNNSAELDAGPYERWMFTHGVRYDLPALELGTSPYRTHVAEVFWPTVKRDRAKEHLAKFLINLQTDGWDTVIKDSDDGSNYHVKIAPMWTDQGRFLPSFIPFVGYVENDTELSGRVEFREIKLAQISSLKGKAERHLSEFLGIELSLDLRMNFPVIQSTFSDSCVQYQSDDVQKLQKIKHLEKDADIPVILAVIDDGIPFAHSNFRNCDGSTRLDFCWSQGATVQQKNNDGSISKGDAGKSSKPSRVQFGREFTAADIDKMVVDFARDEEAIYKECGLLSSATTGPKPLSRMHSHGAHVLSILAGNPLKESEDGMHVIGVDLPPSSSWDTSGFGKDMFILSAMHYIFQRADEISAQYKKGDEPFHLPLVINLSYGISGGPHNGKSLIERAMHEMIAARRKHAPTALVMPSGNTFLDRLHAVIMDKHFLPTKIKDERVANIQWMVPPNDHTSTFLEIWLPPDVVSKDVDLKLEAPDGKWVGLAGSDISNKRDGVIVSAKDIVNLEGKTIGQMTLDRDRNAKARFMIVLAPTEQRPVSPGTEILPTAPAGIWILYFRLRGKLKSIHLADGEPPVAGGLQCFIQRDHNLGQGNTGARQSYFVDPEDDLYFERGNLKQTDNVFGRERRKNGTGNAKVRRFGSISGMATASSTLVVGGCVGTTKLAAPFSSAVALRYDVDLAMPLDKKVAVSAVCEQSPWQPGTVNAGTRTGVNGTVKGTSFAAPIVARALGAKLGTGRQDEEIWSDANSDYSEFLDLTPNSNDIVAHPGSKTRLGDFLS